MKMPKKKMLSFLKDRHFIPFKLRFAVQYIKRNTGNTCLGSTLICPHVGVMKAGKYDIAN